MRAVQKAATTGFREVLGVDGVCRKKDDLRYYRHAFDDGSVREEGAELKRGPGKKKESVVSHGKVAPFFSAAT